jgi:hypothetical protein
MVIPLPTLLSSHVQVVDTEVSGNPEAEDLARISEQLPQVLTEELDYAVCATGFGIEEFVLAALSRAVARTFGEGAIVVKISAPARPIQLCCTTGQDVTADGLLKGVRKALGAGPLAGTRADLVFKHSVLPPDPTFSPVQDNEGPALGILTYHGGELLEIAWWYDSRRLFGETIKELSQQFTLGLIALTSEATPRGAGKAERLSLRSASVIAPRSLCRRSAAS